MDMALFPWGKKKAPGLPQPRKDWFWVLTVGDKGGCSDPTWAQIQEGLYGLDEDTDSYLILEQKNPENQKEYWFIQCAVANQGPDQGKYMVEVDFPGESGPQLWEHVVSNPAEAAAYFSAAYHHKMVDFSGFRDMEF